jgi:hypothetical protein
MQTALPALQFCFAGEERVVYVDSNDGVELYGLDTSN